MYWVQKLSTNQPGQLSTPADQNIHFVLFCILLVCIGLQGNDIYTIFLSLQEKKVINDGTRKSI